MNKFKTDRQIKLIVNNIVNSCKDINKLNKTGYNYLYLSSGFIAHCDVYGFKSYYDCRDLRSDILEYQRFNQYLNFTSKDKDYEYYKQKAQIYNLICDQLRGKK